MVSIALGVRNLISLGDIVGVGGGTGDWFVCDICVCTICEGALGNKLGLEFDTTCGQGRLVEVANVLSLLVGSS